MIIFYLPKYMFKSEHYTVGWYQSKMRTSEGNHRFTEQNKRDLKDAHAQSSYFTEVESEAPKD